MRLEKLIEAYKSANPPAPLVIDNDEVFAYRDGKCVYRDHPGELLQDLLDMAGIPWEPA